ncbi:hypothetical protein DMENIID0001_026010 [Sergentomyia squamirostris]
MGKSEKIPTEERTNTPRSYLVNCVVCVLCLLSIGGSVYTNVRQCYIEDRIRHLLHLDDRIAIIESKLQRVPQSFFDSDVLGIDKVARRLQFELSDLHRLRRDVSHLQVTRRTRQASVQSTGDCLCPADKFPRRLPLDRDFMTR